MFKDEVRKKEDELRKLKGQDYISSSYKSIHPQKIKIFLLSIALIILGIILLSPNITGNVISDFNKTSINLFGMVLITAGALVITFSKKG